MVGVDFSFCVGGKKILMPGFYAGISKYGNYVIIMICTHLNLIGRRVTKEPFRKPVNEKNGKKRTVGVCVLPPCRSEHGFPNDHPNQSV